MIIFPGHKKNQTSILNSSRENKVFFLSFEDQQTDDTKIIELMLIDQTNLYRKFLLNRRRENHIFPKKFQTDGNL